MKLDDYLARIGAVGPVRPDFETLASLHRRHVLSVPFENLDVQLGVRLTTDVDAAYDKIVRRRRGGWCYEQNGLFGWALSTIGFDVMRVAAAVRLDDRGEAALNNHLCLLIRMPDQPDRTFLADVGFGGSMLSPIPFSEEKHSQTPYEVWLERRQDSGWMFRESAPDSDNYYVFAPQAGDESAMASRCKQLQSDPESSFVLNLVVQRRFPDSRVSLRGKSLTTTTRNRSASRILESADELVATVDSVFSLAIPGLADLWSRIEDRHRVVTGD